MASAQDAVAPWQTLYTGDEATGERVIALWQFLPGKEAEDNSGNGHGLELQGQARFEASGKFGSCLESFPADAENDKAQGAGARNHPSLSPAGAFTLEAWLKAKPEMDSYANVFILDKKYYHYAKDLEQANWDYCLYLSRTGENRRRLIAYLGFGTDSAQYTSADLAVEPGVWNHVAFTYDGAGTGRFFVNGEAAGRTTHEGRAAVAPGRYKLVVGDRYGSVHCGFPGYLDQVRVCGGIVPYFRGGLEVSFAAGRTVFVRMEKAAAVRVAIRNDAGVPISGLAGRIRFGGREQPVAVAELGVNGEHTVAVPVDTTLKPGAYQIDVAVSGTVEGRTIRSSKQHQVIVAPRRPPNQMPVVMWGGGDLETLKDIGFTHHLIHLVDYARVWEAGAPTEAMDSGRAQELGQMLDEHLANGIGGVVYVYPGRWAASSKTLAGKYLRIDRAGKQSGHENVSASFPDVLRFGYNVGASVARTFGHYPALQGSLIHSEIRDGTDVSFHPHETQAFQDVAGYPIPREVVGKGGIRYTAIPDFPSQRVIPDDNRILTFYRWFWKDGDGWNPLHTQVHNGLKSTGREDLWTFYDPAVRVPDIWGSGGGVDVISQWTYSYPDPIKIGQATDELFAMAAGAAHDQKVMKMTQIIWYRSGTAPELPEDKSTWAQWEKDIPDARFVTISPDHLREALWSKLSRPIRGIMYHGWGSLVPVTQGGYKFTNPETRPALTQLIRDVVRPLGPTLLQVPDRQSDVAILESFASQVFAGRGTRGWSGSWEADMHLILQWAQVQPTIVFDETVVRDGLDRFRVLVMPCCDVLTESVYQAVAAFQARGGLVVADEHITPAVTPDILVQSRRRDGPADQDKAELQRKAAALRAELDPFYERYGEASNPDVVVRFRQYASTDYLFAINDKRTYGSYVGHHRKVMEKGVPMEATLTVQRASGSVYDLVKHERVPTQRVGDGLAFQAAFGPGAGRLFMIVERPLERLDVSAPERAQVGEPVEVKVSVLDGRGRAVAAVVPVQIDVVDPEGKAAELSGYYGAKDGAVSVRVDLAANDLPGTWSIKVRDLASGKSVARELQVSR